MHRDDVSPSDPSNVGLDAQEIDLERRFHQFFREATAESAARHLCRIRPKSIRLFCDTLTESERIQFKRFRARRVRRLSGMIVPARILRRWTDSDFDDLSSDEKDAVVARVYRAAHVKHGHYATSFSPRMQVYRQFLQYRRRRIAQAMRSGNVRRHFEDVPFDPTATRGFSIMLFFTSLDYLEKCHKIARNRILKALSTHLRYAYCRFQRSLQPLDMVSGCRIIPQYHGETARDYGVCRTDWTWSVALDYRTGQFLLTIVSPEKHQSATISTAMSRRAALAAIGISDSAANFTASPTNPKVLAILRIRDLLRRFVFQPPPLGVID